RHRLPLAAVQYAVAIPVKAQQELREVGLPLADQPSRRLVDGQQTGAGGVAFEVAEHVEGIAVADQVLGVAVALAEAGEAAEGGDKAGVSAGGGVRLARASLPAFAVQARHLRPRRLDAAQAAAVVE